MSGDSRIKLRLLFALLLVVLAGVLIVQNVEPMAVRFLFVTVSMPKAALLVITLLAGVAIGILLALTLSGARRSASFQHPEIEPPQQ
ncbi:MAG: LapA family protein [Desulfurivibrio sp.]